MFVQYVEPSNTIGVKMDAKIKPTIAPKPGRSHKPPIAAHNETQYTVVKAVNSKACR